MKQLEHDNFLPCYGVSTTVSDFCLVFPWYGNGNIMEYLKKNPDINKFELVSTLRQIACSWHLSALENSYRAPSVDCASCTKIDWFTAP